MKIVDESRPGNNTDGFRSLKLECILNQTERTATTTQNAYIAILVWLDGNQMMILCKQI
jgi:hypothetical protein